MGRGLGVLVGLALGSLVGCLLEIEGPSCGDGFHDAETEDCDASSGQRLDANCTCDPWTCQLSCCGNGLIEPGETCEGDDSLTPLTCQQWDCVACQAECRPCGDGVIDHDAGEECDAGVGGVVITPPPPTTCQQLTSPTGEPYAAGGEVACTDECTFDRSTCTLCGNGRLDDRLSDTVDEEVCDGAYVRVPQLLDTCADYCGHLDETLGCLAECSPTCDLEVDDEVACCVLPGKPRSTTLPCCCELANAPSYCGTVFDPGSVTDEPNPALCPRGR